jgi:hypothetical protein
VTARSVIPNGRSRAASAFPIPPIPAIVAVRPSIARPAGTPHSAPRRMRSPNSSSLRLSASAAITHHSATDSAFPLEVLITLPTAIPRRVASAISTLSSPAPHCWISRSPRVWSMKSPSIRAIIGITTCARSAEPTAISTGSS